MPEFARQFLPQSNSVSWAACDVFSVNFSLANQERSKPELVIGDDGKRREWTLAAAAHRAEKRALRRDALHCLNMVERVANRDKAGVVFSRLETDRSLANARQHLVETQRGGV